MTTGNGEHVACMHPYGQPLDTTELHMLTVSSTVALKLRFGIIEAISNGLSILHRRDFLLPSLLRTRPKLSIPVRQWSVTTHLELVDAPWQLFLIMNWIQDGAFRLYLSTSRKPMWRRENRKCFEISVNTSYICFYHNIFNHEFSLWVSNYTVQTLQTF